MGWGEWVGGWGGRGWGWGVGDEVFRSVVAKGALHRVSMLKEEARVVRLHPPPPTPAHPHPPSAHPPTQPTHPLAWMQVLKLLRRKERWLVVAAVRFLRTCLGVKVRLPGGQGVGGLPACLGVKVRGRACGRGGVGVRVRGRVACLLLGALPSGCSAALRCPSLSPPSYLLPVSPFCRTTSTTATL